MKWNKCLNGLMDAATPIYVKGEHVANLFAGQCFHAPPDPDFFREQASRYGFDESEYMNLRGRVIPVVDLRSQVGDDNRKS